MKLYETIFRLCEDKDISITALEGELGWGRGLIGKWRNGTSPNLEKLQKVANYFHVTIDYLITGGPLNGDESVRTGVESASEPFVFSPDEERIIISYRNADEITKGMVRRCLGIDYEEELVPGRKAAEKIAAEFLDAPVAKLK